VAATCGGPSFKPTDTSRVEIEYTEFSDADLNTTATVRGYSLGNSNEVLKKQSLPAVGMPRRDHFYNAGLGGNNIANGNITTFDSTQNGIVNGRSGRFDKLNTGRKAYGNPTQGDLQQANLTNTSNADC